MGFYILPSLKKFCPRNLKCSTSTNQTNMNTSLLKFLSMHLKSSCPWHQSSHIMYWNTLGITISNLNSTSYLEKPTQSSSNPWLLLSLHKEYRPLCYILYDQKPIMTCLPEPAQDRGNSHGHHTRPYTTPCSSLGGNCHHKETSPTTGDQTQL